MGARGLERREGAEPGVAVKTLRNADGAFIYLAAMMPGWKCTSEESHPVYEESFKVYGDVLMGARGVIRQHGYFYRSPGVFHGPLYSRGGTMSFIRSDGPRAPSTGSRRPAAPGTSSRGGRTVSSTTGTAPLTTDQRGVDMPIETAKPPPPASGSGASISIRGVGKTYKTRAGDVRALEPTDLEIRPGEFVVLLGPSGCGKTTLLRMLAGLVTPTSGTIEIGGSTLFSPGSDKPSQDALGSLGSCSSRPTCCRGARCGRTSRSRWRSSASSRAERRRRAEELAELVGLRGLPDHYPRSSPAGCSSASPSPAR